VLILWQEKENKEEQQQKITYYKDIENFIKEKTKELIFIDSFQTEEQTTESGNIIRIKMNIRSAINNDEIRNHIQTTKQQLEINYKKTFIFQISSIATSDISVE
jgi:hypothetical protein